MKLVKSAVAGTVESSDIMITLCPSEREGIHIELESSVVKQFGERIRAVITQTLTQAGVVAADVVAVDKGVLDCTIQARTITALYRAAERDDYDWKEIDSWNV